MITKLKLIKLNLFIGDPLETTDRVYQNGSNLHIQMVNKTQDVGEYACIAYSKSTGAREATTEARLDVICKYKESKKKGNKLHYILYYEQFPLNLLHHFSSFSS